MIFERLKLAMLGVYVLMYFSGIMLQEVCCLLVLLGENTLI